MTAATLSSQDLAPSYEKHGVVWSVGLFKSWLKDDYVDFNQIEDEVTPHFFEKYKQGFAVQSHYMYKPAKWIGFGIHLGLGLDVNSYIESPLVLFGPTISFGSRHQFIIDFGFSDGKRREVPSALRTELNNTVLTEIPTLYDKTQLNTGYYMAITYRI